MARHLIPMLQRPIWKLFTGGPQTKLGDRRWRILAELRVENQTFQTFSQISLFCQLSRCQSDLLPQLIKDIRTIHTSSHIKHIKHQTHQKLNLMFDLWWVEPQLISWMFHSEVELIESSGATGRQAPAPAPAPAEAVPPAAPLGVDIGKWTIW